MSMANRTVPLEREPSPWKEMVPDGIVYNENSNGCLSNLHLISHSVTVSPQGEAYINFAFCI